MTDLSDAELVTRVLNGDTDAYGVLVRRYQDAFLRFAIRMLGSRDDADDALQSAFLRAYRSLGLCRDPARFGAWLHQIVINECRTFGARRTRRERVVLSDLAEVERAADHQSETVADMDVIQKALDQLEDSQREAFVLKYVEELSYDEMAVLTGAGESALKMRVKRARERLRQLLEEAGSVQ